MVISLALALACAPAPQIIDPADPEVLTDTAAPAPDSEEESAPALPGGGMGSAGGAGGAPPEMEPLELLTRLSLDLRGVRPSLDEIERVEADPAALDALTGAFLSDDRLGDRLVSLYAEVFLTRVDSFDVDAGDYQMEAVDDADFAASVGQEPLQVLARIAREDLPYTDLVTADWTMADPVLAAAWALDYPAGETGWQVAAYTDGRPAAGILSANSMWWRFGSTASNSNRGRANAVSRILLCSDFLARPITFDRDVNLLDEAAVEQALQTNPGCVACHYALEPLAAYFWGFYYFDYDNPADISWYHPERERMWEDYANIAPSYFGEPGWGLADLGRQIAGDARFPECAVETAWRLMLQREVTLDDTARLSILREDFLGSDLRLRALYRAVIESPEYRSGPSDDPSAAPRKMVTPDLLASQIEALTGFRFMSDGYDMMGTDTVGLRTLAGGVDGRFVTAPAREPGATASLVVERLAEAAAAYVVEQDRLADAPRLFAIVDFSETPAVDPEPIAQQIVDLHLRLFAHRVALDGPEVEANLALFTALYEAERSPAAAWAGLLSALLRDPDFLFY